MRVGGGVVQSVPRTAPQCFLLGECGVPWAAPIPPDNCLNWALIRETGGKKPSSSLPGERINQVSLKNDDVCTLQLRVGEGLGWATWKSTG